MALIIMLVRDADPVTGGIAGAGDDMPVINSSQGTARTARHADLTVVRRLATLMKDVQLDCECRSRLDEALARFAALEERRLACQHLASARRQRERIEAVLFFLQDLDDLLATESDRSVFLDIALLFEDIATTATMGAGSMRQLSMSAAAESDES